MNITEELALMAVKLDKMKAIEENASRLCLERMNELENAKSAMEHKIIELGQLYVKPVWNAWIDDGFWKFAICQYQIDTEWIPIKAKKIISLHFCCVQWFLRCVR